MLDVLVNAYNDILHFDTNCAVKEAQVEQKIEKPNDKTLSEIRVITNSSSNSTGNQFMSDAPGMSI